MHELSIAQNIVEIAIDSVPDKDRNKIERIMLEIGDMSGIVSDSLQFCFDVIKKDTPLKNTEMIIKKIPFLIFCNSCKAETTNEFGIRSCGICNEFNTRVISGTEMKITGLELNV